MSSGASPGWVRSASEVWQGRLRSLLALGAPGIPRHSACLRVAAFLLRSVCLSVFSELLVTGFRVPLNSQDSSARILISK